jgi:hypothetical protein
MKQTHRLVAATVIAVAALVLAAAGPAPAYTPQTIVVDGVNDFLLANLVENDSSDTQFSQLDLRRIYVTNDANNLYFGLGQDKTGWTTVQIGVMISTVGKNGATNDMWSHRIGWSGAHTPGYGAYKNYDNNWQEFRTWTGSAWSAPLRAGPGANGMSNGTAFQEISFLLCELGVAAGDSLWFEVVVTQDGSTKGPLDLSRSDSVQLSTPGGTVFDPPAPIVVPLTWGYKVQSTGDAVKPTVVSAAKRTPFTVSVVFSEPVELGTSQTESNYVLGGTAAIVLDAVRNTTSCNVVDLSLSQNIGPKNGLYSVTVNNVQDQAGNVILSNGVTNKAEFALKKLTFRGKMQYYLQSASNPPNTFSVEGDVAPLTFGPTCDSGVMTNTGVDSIFQAQVEFCVEKRAGSATADTTLEWKFLHNCATYEPLANNRSFLITSALGAEDTLEAYWADQDPTQFLSHPIDVVFRADLSAVAVPTDTVAVDGNLPPLNWNVPSVTPMLDNGVAPDAVAGDKIYTKRVRFATGSMKNLEFKFLRNQAFECGDSLLAQGNRTAFLNDAAFDTTGGTLGPLTLPIGVFDYCTIISHPVKVVWRLKTDPGSWPQHMGDYYAPMNAAQVVPTNGSTATGNAGFTLDSLKYLRYVITHSGLSSAETGATIRGPAKPGENAGTLFTLPLGAHKTGAVGPLNATQERDLNAGMWYVNIATSGNPGGEIRGQIIPTHAVAVRGSAAPLSWGSDLQLRDDGRSPDLAAGDDVYSGEATFPTSTNQNVEWKYVVGSVFENRFNRNVYLNDALFSEGTPIVFTDTLDVTTDVVPGAVASKLVLRQNEPNPFNPTTRIAFVVPQAGRYRLAVYDALGRRVRVLWNGDLPAGPGAVLWDGRTESGVRAGSGIYLYALEDPSGARTSRKMVLLK